MTEALRLEGTDFKRKLMMGSRACQFQLSGGPYRRISFEVCNLQAPLLPIVSTCALAPVASICAFSDRDTTEITDIMSAIQCALTETKDAIHCMC